MKSTNLVILAIIVVSFAIGISLYPQLPDTIPSHWDASGNVNGYMTKFWGVFLMPIMSIILYGIFLLIPIIDPRKENIQKFRTYFDNFILVIMLFFFYVYILTLLWALNYRFNMIIALIPAMSLLFYYAGILIQKAKRNWFIGIRTPWTLESETVWDKTHEVTAKLFKASAIIGLIGLFFQNLAICFVVIPVMVSAIFGVVYSYILYKKEKTP